MGKYWDVFIQGYTGYYNYLLGEILNPNWHNYFYWLIGLSLLSWGLEMAFPWRKNQSIFRKDFWKDAFYMFFNFFLFSLLIYNGLSNVFVHLFSDGLGFLGIENLVAIQIQSWPVLAQFLLLFVLADFIQWNVHRTLHRVPWMWEFHKVHHSVKEMGFAAHLRFHWMETVFYKAAQYIPLSMIGFGISDFFILHIFTVFVGHLNHANVPWDYGFLKRILNNPKMHIWHHSKDLPASHSQGMNFGITLSIWDYLFKTAYLPNSGRDIELGFHGDEHFPNELGEQLIHPIKVR
ncbi:MAG: sterol desaturase/sphingolipid hydroxylase (fatty acid hydroxylase superfamily) [Luteibaculaceae bacterium]|jgi:sterol desaturase/sphingolipid hydroxylase (fatty acid hydroxylase superfamily)